MPGTLLAGIFLIITGVVVILTSKNLVKMIMAFSILESAILLFAIVGAYIPGSDAPLAQFSNNIVNPVPHALTLTAIVIGAGTTALALSFIMKLYKFTKSLSVVKLNKLKG